jgi:pilus assembly protein CpaE
MTPPTAKDQTKVLSGENFSSREPLSVLTICVDEDTAQSVRFFAESTPLIRIQLRRNEYRTQDTEPIREYMGDPLPDVCLVDFDRQRHSAAATAEQIHAAAPESAIFAISDQRQPERIIEAMRSGCSEYLVKPLDREQLLNAVARVAARRKEKKETYTGQVLAFIGAKGGCGVTTLATQFGALLASSLHRKALVLDLHPDFGDAALYLGLTKTNYHFFELLENIHRLDTDFLHSFLVHHSSGLDLIPAPEGSGGSGEIVPGTLMQTVDFLRQRFEFVIADLPPGLNDDNLEFIRACDQLYLVTVAEVSAVRNVVRQMEYFERKDIPKDKIRVILNRHQKRSVVSDEQIEKVIDQKIYWRVPNQYPQVMKTIHEGDPVAQLSNSEVARSLKEWAGVVGKRSGSEDKDREKRDSAKFFGLWNR